ncbi:hypothetical protein [Flavobacterium gilvum]|uniref:Uncharacterized protein n=1 Tax=Flavobacterium gilvum TaxID=1492737 RepID=A0AAC9I503_9FLAO|nr:hypothetical protein [Flavobacterium gilvum]AOW08723.1 hypothetical protein EM308_03975 [Flavobacterium gilvum]KFC59838.1 hypothetical protein FEM08_13490 [Flavobacterium gilvum]
MEKFTTYKVTFKETADEWVFQYRDTDKVIHAFFNIKGVRVLKLLENVQFPGTIPDMEKWTKYKNIVTIELVLDDYSFETFWLKYNLKVKKEASQKAFEKLSLVEKIKCFNALKKYDEFLAKTGQAKAHLVTWINQKRFNDEY